jgi:hypothetical protein
MRIGTIRSEIDDYRLGSAGLRQKNDRDSGCPQGTQRGNYSANSGMRPGVGDHTSGSGNVAHGLPRAGPARTLTVWGAEHVLQGWPRPEVSERHPEFSSKILAVRWLRFRHGSAAAGSLRQKSLTGKPTADATRRASYTSQSTGLEQRRAHSQSRHGPWPRRPSLKAPPRHSTPRPKKNNLSRTPDFSSKNRDPARLRSRERTLAMRGTARVADLQRRFQQIFRTPPRWQITMY